MRSGVSPTPYQQQAELDFDKPFWELWFAKTTPRPPSGTGGFGFLRTFLYIFVNRNPTPPVADRGWSPWPIINNLLENALRGVPHPLSARGGVGFWQTFLRIICWKDWQKQLLHPLSGTGGLGFLRIFSTHNILAFSAELWVLGECGGHPMRRTRLWCKLTKYYNCWVISVKLKSSAVRVFVPDFTIFFEIVWFVSNAKTL